MKFVSDGVTWIGFQHVTPDAAPGTLLVIVWFDGEPDLWNVADAEGLDNLRRYYRQEWGTDRAIPITVATVGTRPDDW